MKRIFCLLLVFIIFLVPASIFAEEDIVETESILTTEIDSETLIENIDEEVIVEENVDNADSQYDLLLGKIDVLISLIYCWFLWAFFCAIYKVLYRLFCFVI